MARATTQQQAPSPPKKKSGGVGGLLVVFIIGWLAGRCSTPESSPTSVEAAIEAPATTTPQTTDVPASARPPANAIAAQRQDLAGAFSSQPQSGAPEESAATDPPTPGEAEKLKPLLYVTTDALNVRDGPGAEFAVVGKLSRGDSIGVLERSGSWARVNSPAAAGWVSASALSDTKPQAAPPTLSDGRIRDLLIQQSLSFYSGSCPCPYNVDRGGRSCGGRSAYSRPGGASPLCYRTDISDADVRAYRERIRE